MASEKKLQTQQDNSSERLSKVHYREINPFRGLESFDSEHAPFFYGRTKIVREALDLLRQQVADKKPFLLVLGPAGSGKTSLIRAGILPALTRPEEIEGAGHSWRLAFTRPGNAGAGDPFDALAAALLEKSALPEFPDAAPHNGWQNLAAELREAPDNTALRLRETLQCLSVQALDHLLDKQGSEVPSANAEENAELLRQNKPVRFDSKVRLALVVDQLEELFVQGFSPELQQRFITALGALIRWRVALVICGLRSDFYASFEKCCSSKDVGARNQSELCALNIELSEFLTGRFDLHPPSLQEIGEMICLAAEAVGLRFELDLETGRILDAVLLEAAAAHAEPLPPLEHLLWQLYRKQLPRKDGLLRWSDYYEAGELEGAVANHAESVFSALDGDAQAALKPIVRQLASPGPDDDGVLIRRTVPYRDLTSTPEFREHQKAGAERLIDLFIKEGLFHTERGPNAEVLVSFTQEYVLRNWPRVRQLLNEDLGLLRTRDRLESNFKLWFSGGRRSHNLVRTRSGVRDVEALLRGFRTSLSHRQVNYLQKSLGAKNRRRWLQGAAVLAIAAGLVVPFVIPGVQWLRATTERRKAEQSSGPEGRVAHSVNTGPESFETGQRENGESARLPQGNAPIATSERDALQGRLNDAEARAQQIQKSLELVISQRDALQGRLNDSEARAQGIQKSLDLAASQRDGLHSQLKDAEAKAQQAQKDAEHAGGQRDALQNQLKDTEAKAQQAQKDAAQAGSQRDALQNQLKDTEAKAQQAQKDAAQAGSQRDALQGQLRETEAKVRQAQKDAAQAGSQRDALQNQLKDTEAKAQQAQRDTSLVTSQRDALQGQLRQARKDAEAAAGKRDVLQARPTEAETEAQQAQKNAGLATKQSDALQAKLKDAKAKSQQAQKNVELVEAQAEKGDQSSGESSQKNSVFSANRTESKQSQQPNTGLKAEPLASTQASAFSIQPAHTTAMSRSASEGADSAEATVGHQEPMKLAQTDQRNAALPQPSPTQPASVNPPLVEAQADKSTDDAVDGAAVKRFVLEYIRTVTNDDVSTQERFFAQRVNFYGEGVLPLQGIRAANERYRREWPNRDWQPQGEPNILHSANSNEYEVLQPITWKVSNGPKHAQGNAKLNLRVRKNTEGNFHIVWAQYRDR